MKTSILFLSLFLCIHSIAQEENKVVMTDLIVYRVLNENFTTEQNAEAVKLFNILTDTNVIYKYDCYKGNPLVSNKYKYDSGTNINKLSNKEIRNAIYQIEIEKIWDVNNSSYVIDTLVNKDYSEENFPSFIFSESWEYDTVDFQFYKNIDLINPMINVYNSHNEFVAYYSLLDILLCNNTFENANWSIKNVQYDVCINDIVNRDRNEFFYLWEVVENIEASDRFNFMEYVFTSIDNVSIKAYKDVNKTKNVNSTSDFIQYYIDTIALAGKNYDTIITNVFDFSLYQFSHLRFIEDWYFDIEKQSFIKKVKAIGFMREEWDDKTFKSKGFNPVFWVFFD